MIQLEGITKSFGSLQVLKGIDLTINKGEVVSIVGPSGAGKTTLLQIMGTLDKPDAGRIVLNHVRVPVSPIIARVYGIRERDDTGIDKRHFGTERAERSGRDAGFLGLG